MKKLRRETSLELHFVARDVTVITTPVKTSSNVWTLFCGPPNGSLSLSFSLCTACFLEEPRTISSMARYVTEEEAAECRQEAAEKGEGKTAKEWSREIRYKRTPNRRPRWVGQSKRRELGQTTSEISYLAFSALSSAGRLMRVALMDDHFERAVASRQAVNRRVAIASPSRISFSVRRRGIAPCPDGEELCVRI